MKSIIVWFMVITAISYSLVQYKEYKISESKQKVIHVEGNDYYSHEGEKLVYFEYKR